MVLPAITTPILIVGAGPTGLATAIELGRRKIDCILVEQGDGAITHPRATALNARSMEFLRRWGVADRVREAGIPADFPHTVLYLTSLDGYLLARIDRPGHGEGTSSPTSPERPQRCNQLWLDPILAERVRDFATVDVRYSTKLESFSTTAQSVDAIVRDVVTGERRSITARYLVDCSGGRSTIRESLGIAMNGAPTVDYNVSIFLRIPQLWTFHDKGKAALHSFVGLEGVKSTLIALDGRELWRLGLRGKEYYDASRSLDVDAIVRRYLGPSIPYEVVSVGRWMTHDLVADRLHAERVFLVGDAAHLNAPSGGFGLNTGFGDVIDIGWKLAAVIAGWAPEALLDSYNLERRPVAARNVAQATENYRSGRYVPPPQELLDASPAGDNARAAWGERILTSETRTYVTDGIALGYSYDASPIIIDDGTPQQPASISTYEPTTRPGGRAPHAWLQEGRSILDLYGHDFVLICSGSAGAGTDPLAAAFAARAVPFSAVHIDDPQTIALYERAFVLVRPDGHVAWRSDELPADPDALVAHIIGIAANRPRLPGTPLSS